ncbi:hypothetical protein JKP88DRAFT_286722 [Tribonema minus]|uniref:Uncharacterized protein n=1 Tax=Tribonema minus TaxID=303371 RepID=A0A836CKD5_9STRA|nr:hypothetical protein JKP88DRAFT_286722 [Tribonema minus]
MTTERCGGNGTFGRYVGCGAHGYCGGAALQRLHASKVDGTAQPEPQRRIPSSASAAATLGAIDAVLDGKAGLTALEIAMAEEAIG